MKIKALATAGITLAAFGIIGLGAVPASAATCGPTASFASSNVIGSNITVTLPCSFSTVRAPLTYKWSRNGATIQGSGASHTLTAADNNQKLTVVVSYNNGQRGLNAKTVSYTFNSNTLALKAK